MNSRKRTGFKLFGNTFATGLTAFALITAVAAAPARAGDEDVAKAIGGLLTLFVISKALENGKTTASVQTTTPKIYRHIDKPRASRENPFAIPAKCIVKVRNADGKNYSVAKKNCLDKRPQKLAPLPRRCETQVRANRGPITAYKMNCLDRFGYVVKRGRNN